MNGKKPIKAKSLRIIDYKDILYATLDGEKMWEIDKLIYKLLQECDGKKTFDDIAKMISEKSGMNIEDIKIGLKEIFDELEKNKVIEYVD